MNIKLNPVESSQIHSIGHSPETNTLAICFLSHKTKGPGSVYHYSNFTTEDFNNFQMAESIGSHFGKYIKSQPAKYPYTKVS